MNGIINTERPYRRDYRSDYSNIRSIRDFMSVLFEQAVWEYKLLIRRGVKFDKNGKVIHWPYRGRRAICDITIDEAEQIYSSLRDDLPRYFAGTSIDPDAALSRLGIQTDK